MFSVLASLASVAMAATLTIYPETGIIINVDTSTDTVEVSALSGEVYAFIGVEDWETGDICSMLMDSKGTEKIADDEIVRALYCGNIEQIMREDEEIKITFSNGTGYWYKAKEER